MKRIINQGAQGDVYFIRRDAIPDGYAVACPTNGKNVVAHSETGHNHIVDASDAILFEGPDPLVGYLRLADGSDECAVVHQRDYHTHETVGLGGGSGTVWEVRRQREYTSQGLRRAQD